VCSSDGSAWFAQFTGTQLVDAGFWLLRLKINGALFSTHAAHMHNWHSGLKLKRNNKTTNLPLFQFPRIIFRNKNDLSQ
jgi:hypothetical protein